MTFCLCLDDFGCELVILAELILLQSIIFFS